MELPAANPGNEIEAAIQTHFFINIIQMGFYRGKRDEQLSGDGGVTFSLDDFEDDLLFAIGDPVSGEELFGERLRNACGKRVVEKIKYEKDSIQCIWY